MDPTQLLESLPGHFALLRQMPKHRRQSQDLAKLLALCDTLECFSHLPKTVREELLINCTLRAIPAEHAISFDLVPSRGAPSLHGWYRTDMSAFSADKSFDSKSSSGRDKTGMMSKTLFHHSDPFLRRLLLQYRDDRSTTGNVAIGDKSRDAAQTPKSEADMGNIYIILSGTAVEVPVRHVLLPTTLAPTGGMLDPVAAGATTADGNSDEVYDAAHRAVLQSQIAQHQQRLQQQIQGLVDPSSNALMFLRPLISTLCPAMPVRMLDDAGSASGPANSTSTKPPAASFDSLRYPGTASVLGANPYGHAYLASPQESSRLLTHARSTGQVVGEDQDVLRESLPSRLRPLVSSDEFIEHLSRLPSAEALLEKLAPYNSTSVASHVTSVHSASSETGSINTASTGASHAPRNGGVDTLTGATSPHSLDVPVQPYLPLSRLSLLEVDARGYSANPREFPAHYFADELEQAYRSIANSTPLTHHGGVIPEGTTTGSSSSLRLAADKVNTPRSKSNLHSPMSDSASFASFESYGLESVGSNSDPSNQSQTTADEAFLSTLPLTPATTPSIATAEWIGYGAYALTPCLVLEISPAVLIHLRNVLKQTILYQRARLLGQMPAFAPWTLEERLALANMAREVTLPEFSRIGFGIFIVAKGQIEVYREWELSRTEARRIQEPESILYYDGDEDEESEEDHSVSEFPDSETEDEQLRNAPQQSESMSVGSGTARPTQVLKFSSSLETSSRSQSKSPKPTGLVPIHRLTQGCMYVEPQYLLPAVEAHSQTDTTYESWPEPGSPSASSHSNAYASPLTQSPQQMPSILSPRIRLTDSLPRSPPQKSRFFGDDFTFSEENTFLTEIPTEDGQTRYSSATKSRFKHYELLYNLNDEERASHPWVTKDLLDLCTAQAFESVKGASISDASDNRLSRLMCTLEPTTLLVFNPQNWREAMRLLKASLSQRIMNRAKESRDEMYRAVLSPQLGSEVRNDYAQYLRALHESASSVSLSRLAHATHLMNHLISTQPSDVTASGDRSSAVTAAMESFVHAASNATSEPTSGLGAATYVPPTSIIAPQAIVFALTVLSGLVVAQNAVESTPGLHQGRRRSRRQVEILTDLILNSGHPKVLREPPLDLLTPPELVLPSHYDGGAHIQIVSDASHPSSAALAHLPAGRLIVPPKFVIPVDIALSSERFFNFPTLRPAQHQLSMGDSSQDQQGVQHGYSPSGAFQPHSLLSLLPRRAALHMFANARIRLYRSGEVLYEQDTVCKKVFIILNGLAVATRTTSTVASTFKTSGSRPAHQVARSAKKRGATSPNPVNPPKDPNSTHDETGGSSNESTRLSAAPGSDDEGNVAVGVPQPSELQPKASSDGKLESGKDSDESPDSNASQSTKLVRQAATSLSSFILALTSSTTASASAAKTRARSTDSELVLTHFGPGDCVGDLQLLPVINAGRTKADAPHEARPVEPHHGVPQPTSVIAATPTLLVAEIPRLSFVRAINKHCDEDWVLPSWRTFAALCVHPILRRASLDILCQLSYAAESMSYSASSVITTSTELAIPMYLDHSSQQDSVSQDHAIGLRQPKGIYFILSGKVDIVTTGVLVPPKHDAPLENETGQSSEKYMSQSQKPLVLATLQAGSHFGESCLLKSTTSVSNAQKQVINSADPLTTQVASKSAKATPDEGLPLAFSLVASTRTELIFIPVYKLQHLLTPSQVEQFIQLHKNRNNWLRRRQSELLTAFGGILRPKVMQSSSDVPLSLQVPLFAAGKTIPHSGNSQALDSLSAISSSLPRISRTRTLAYQLQSGGPAIAGGFGSVQLQIPLFTLLNAATVAASMIVTKATAVASELAQILENSMAHSETVASLQQAFSFGFNGASVPSASRSSGAAPDYRTGKFTNASVRPPGFGSDLSLAIALGLLTGFGLITSDASELQRLGTTTAPAPGTAPAYISCSPRDTIAAIVSAFSNFMLDGQIPVAALRVCAGLGPWMQAPLRMLTPSSPSGQRDNQATDSGINVHVSHTLLDFFGLHLCSSPMATLAGVGSIARGTYSLSRVVNQATDADSTLHDDTAQGTATEHMPSLIGDPSSASGLSHSSAATLAWTLIYHMESAHSFGFPISGSVVQHHSTKLQGYVKIRTRHALQERLFLEVVVKELQLMQKNLETEVRGGHLRSISASGLVNSMMSSAGDSQSTLISSRRAAAPGRVTSTEFNPSPLRQSRDLPNLVPAPTLRPMLGSVPTNLPVNLSPPRLESNRWYSFLRSPRLCLDAVFDPVLSTNANALAHRLAYVANATLDALEMQFESQRRTAVRSDQREYGDDASPQMRQVTVLSALQVTMGDMAALVLGLPAASSFSDGILLGPIIKRSALIGASPMQVSLATISRRRRESIRTSSSLEMTNPFAGTNGCRARMHRGSVILHNLELDAVNESPGATRSLKPPLSNANNNSSRISGLHVKAPDTIASLLRERLQALAESSVTARSRWKFVLDATKRKSMTRSGDQTSLERSPSLGGRAATSFFELVKSISPGVRAAIDAGLQDPSDGVLGGSSPNDFLAEGPVFQRYRHRRGMTRDFTSHLAADGEQTEDTEGMMWLDQALKPVAPLSPLADRVQTAMDKLVPRAVRAVLRSHSEKDLRNAQSEQIGPDQLKSNQSETQHVPLPSTTDATKEFAVEEAPAFPLAICPDPPLTVAGLGKIGLTASELAQEAKPYVVPGETSQQDLGILPRDPLDDLDVDALEHIMTHAKQTNIVGAVRTAIDELDRLARTKVSTSSTDVDAGNSHRSYEAMSRRESQKRSGSPEKGSMNKVAKSGFAFVSESLAAAAKARVSSGSQNHASTESQARTSDTPRLLRSSSLASKGESRTRNGPDRRSSLSSALRSVAQNKSSTPRGSRISLLHQDSDLSEVSEGSNEEGIDESMESGDSCSDSEVACHFNQDDTEANIIPAEQQGLVDEERSGANAMTSKSERQTHDDVGIRLTPEPRSSVCASIPSSVSSSASSSSPLKAFRHVSSVRSRRASLSEMNLALPSTPDPTVVLRAHREGSDRRSPAPAPPLNLEIPPHEHGDVTKSHYLSSPPSPAHSHSSSWISGGHSFDAAMTGRAPDSIDNLERESSEYDVQSPRRLSFSGWLQDTNSGQGALRSVRETSFELVPSILERLQDEVILLQHLGNQQIVEFSTDRTTGRHLSLLYTDQSLLSSDDGTTTESGQSKTTLSNRQVEALDKLRCFVLRNARENYNFSSLADQGVLFGGTLSSVARRISKAVTFGLPGNKRRFEPAELPRFAVSALDFGSERTSREQSREHAEDVLIQKQLAERGASSRTLAPTSALKVSGLQLSLISGSTRPRNSGDDQLVSMMSTTPDARGIISSAEDVAKLTFSGYTPIYITPSTSSIPDGTLKTAGALIETPTTDEHYFANDSAEQSTALKSDRICAPTTTLGLSSLAVATSEAGLDFASPGSRTSSNHSIHSSTAEMDPTKARSAVRDLLSGGEQRALESLLSLREDLESRMILARAANRQPQVQGPGRLRHYAKEHQPDLALQRTSRVSSASAHSPSTGESSYGVSAPSTAHELEGSDSLVLRAAQVLTRYPEAVNADLERFGSTTSLLTARFTDFVNYQLEEVRTKLSGNSADSGRLEVEQDNPRPDYARPHARERMQNTPLLLRTEGAFSVMDRVLVSPTTAEPPPDRSFADDDIEASTVGFGLPIEQARMLVLEVRHLRGLSSIPIPQLLRKFRRLFSDAGHAARTLRQLLNQVAKTVLGADSHPTEHVITPGDVLEDVTCLGVTQSAQPTSENGQAGPAHATAKEIAAEETALERTILNQLLDELSPSAVDHHASTTKTASVGHEKRNPMGSAASTMAALATALDGSNSAQDPLAVLAARRNVAISRDQAQTIAVALGVESNMAPSVVKDDIPGKRPDSSADRNLLAKSPMRQALNVALLGTTKDSALSEITRKQGASEADTEVDVSIAGSSTSPEREDSSKAVTGSVNADLPRLAQRDYDDDPTPFSFASVQLLSLYRSPQHDDPVLYLLVLLADPTPSRIRALQRAVIDRLKDEGENVVVVSAHVARQYKHRLRGFTRIARMSTSNEDDGEDEVEGIVDDGLEYIETDIDKANVSEEGAEDSKVALKLPGSERDAARNWSLYLDDTCIPRDYTVGFRKDRFFRDGTQDDLAEYVNSAQEAALGHLIQFALKDELDHELGFATAGPTGNPNSRTPSIFGSSLSRRAHHDDTGHGTVGAFERRLLAAVLDGQNAKDYADSLRRANYARKHLRNVVALVWAMKARNAADAAYREFDIVRSIWRAKQRSQQSQCVPQTAEPRLSNGIEEDIEVSDDANDITAEYVHDMREWAKALEHRARAAEERARRAILGKFSNPSQSWQHLSEETQRPKALATIEAARASGAWVPPILLHKLKHMRLTEHQRIGTIASAKYGAFTTAGIVRGVKTLAEDDKGLHSSTRSSTDLREDIDDMDFSLRDNASSSQMTETELSIPPPGVPHPVLSTVTDSDVPLSRTSTSARSNPPKSQALPRPLARLAQKIGVRRPGEGTHRVPEGLLSQNLTNSAAHTAHRDESASTLTRHYILPPPPRNVKMDECSAQKSTLGTVRTPTQRYLAPVSTEPLLRDRTEGNSNHQNASLFLPAVSVGTDAARAASCPVPTNPEHKRKPVSLNRIPLRTSTARRTSSESATTSAMSSGPATSPRSAGDVTEATGSGTLRLLQFTGFNTLSPPALGRRAQQWLDSGAHTTRY